MPDRFSECLDFVLDREGRTTAEATGDLDTSFGVTQPVYDAYRKEKGLPLQDVDLGTAAEFEDIYRVNYWLASLANQLPAPLDLLHFDSAVNLGVATANRMLQTALNMGLVDGVVGSRTLNAVKLADPLVTCARYCNLRVTRYIVVSASKPQLRKFFRGWLHRMGYLLLAV